MYLFENLNKKKLLKIKCPLRVTGGHVGVGLAIHFPLNPIYVFLYRLNR